MNQQDIATAFAISTDGSSALWTQLTQASDRDTVSRAWLILLCEKIADTVAGAVIFSENDTYLPVAQWPAEAREVDRLVEIIDEVLSGGGGLLSRLSPPPGAYDQKRQYYAFAYPVLIDGEVAGAAAIEVAVDSEAAVTEIMRQLQWAIAWLEVLVRRQHAGTDQQTQKQLQDAMDLFAIVLAEKESTAAAMGLVTELAHIMQADRVSIGFWEHNKIRIEAVSHSAEFSQRMNLIRSVSEAMEEAIEQRHSINFSVEREHSDDIVLAHKALARQHGAGNILTIPLYQQDRFYAAVILERPHQQSFNEHEVKYSQAILALAGSALQEKCENDLPYYKKTLQAVQQQWRRLVGPRYAGRKLAAAVIVISALFFTFASGDYRVNANVTLEGSVRRVVAAPYNGFISESSRRAGDIVSSDEVMAELDDRELRLERIKWASQYAQLQRQYQEALAKRNRAQVSILGAQIKQAKAQLDLAENRLMRTSIKAPFAGVIASGDLSQRLGGAVQQGEVLFEVTPLNDYRVILEVDEKRIGDIKVKQRGPLVLSSLPDQEFWFVVDKIMPVTVAHDGVNYFRVEAQLEGATERLRPGMKGVGKVMVDERRLIWIWTQSLREWLDMQAWVWLGL